MPGTLVRNATSARFEETAVHKETIGAQQALCHDSPVRGVTQNRGVARRLSLALGLGAIAIALGAGVAQGERIKSGDLIVSLSGEIEPHVLPRDKAVPVRMHVEGDVETLGGGQPPPLRRLTVAVNRQGKLFTRGLPNCTSEQLQGTSTGGRAGGLQTGAGRARAFRRDCRLSLAGPLPGARRRPRLQRSQGRETGDLPPHLRHQPDAGDLRPAADHRPPRRGRLRDGDLGQPAPPRRGPRLRDRHRVHPLPPLPLRGQNAQLPECELLGPNWVPGHDLHLRQGHFRLRRTGSG